MEQSTSGPPSSDQAPPKWKFWLKPKDEISSENEKYPPVPYYALFRYTSRTDKAIALLSICAAVAHGALFPVLLIIYGRTLDDFGAELCPESDHDCVPTADLGGAVGGIINWYLYISVVAFALAFTQLTLGMISANRIGNDLRRRFFDSLIRQDCDFYDDAQAGSLTNMIVNDIQLIQAGVGDKLATAIQYNTTFVVALIVGFVYGWKLTLLIIGVTPLLLIAGLIFGNASADATGEGLGAYGEAGGIAMEVLSLIRTVTAFGGQEEEARRYERSLDKATKAGIKAAINSGLGLGTAMLFTMGSYGLAFWVGGILARKNEMSVGDVLLTFFALSIGASYIGMTGPAFKSFSVARAAAPRVFEVIDRKSSIDPLDSTGIIPSSPASGRLTFENVNFNYVKRITEDGESELVLDTFNIDIPVGSSEAFVGKSGCGKSTIARLMQRLYDPLQGSVKLDGIDLRELNVHWLRSQIGVVSQTPSLFRLTIRENIKLGAGMEFLMDEKSGMVLARLREVSDDEMIAAAKMANAHGFISHLPEKYDTMLGERGAMLSGGQRQRVCIARALVRNPKVLLLDESTSNLDTSSERIVQDALEKAATGRTTVTIAHRLSTVKNADQISCIHQGRVLERGPHNELINREGGFYKGLFDLQNIQRAKLEKERELDQQTGDADEKQLQSEAAPSVSRTAIDSTTADVGGVLSDDEKKPATDKGVFWRTLKMNRGEYIFFGFGAVGSLVGGVVWPLASISMSKLIEIITFENRSSDVRKWALSFVILGALSFFGNAMQHGSLGIAGEKLTRKIRGMAFRALLKQEIGYFDMEENSVGALAGRLSLDAGAVKGLTGDLLGVTLNAVGAVICGFIIAFINCWQLSLVILAILPGVALGGYFEMEATAGMDSGGRKEIARANMVAAEAIDNIATIRILGVEAYFANRYSDIIQMSRAAKLRKSLINGTAYGFSEFCQFLVWYASFKAGADFVEKEYCTYSEMLLTAMAMLFTAFTVGNVAVFAPDIGAARVGATHVYRLLDRQSQIDPSSNEGDEVDHVDGDVAADHVFFEYPRRPDVPVLRGLTLNVTSGKTLAIVGTSGHGKSTIIALLERFYNIRRGRITMDRRDISQMRVQDLRSHLGIVSQEPELFNRSVFDNIAYSLSRDGTPITMDEVVEAAKVANAHEFVSLLPQGYDTLVGPRGEAISGGQRQRVAIARSLLRRPPVLLLDEATSSLDSTSERLVQDALDRASGGRTTLIVAHRLSTVRNADKIVVVRKGRIVESGNHESLLRKNGFYAELIQHQLSDV